MRVGNAPKTQPGSALYDTAVLGGEQDTADTTVYDAAVSQFRRRVRQTLADLKTQKGDVRDEKVPGTATMNLKVPETVLIQHVVPADYNAADMSQLPPPEADKANS